MISIPMNVIVAAGAICAFFAVCVLVIIALSCAEIRMATEDTRDEMRGIRSELRKYREGRL